MRGAGVRHSRCGVVKPTKHSDYMMLNAANTVFANCERKILSQSSEEHRPLSIPNSGGSITSQWC